MNDNTRKPNRLINYDYSSNGLYFVTICTRNRVHYLSEITGNELFGKNPSTTTLSAMRRNLRKYALT